MAVALCKLVPPLFFIEPPYSGCCTSDNTLQVSICLFKCIQFILFLQGSKACVFCWVCVCARREPSWDFRHLRVGSSIIALKYCIKRSSGRSKQGPEGHYQKNTAFTFSFLGVECSLYSCRLRSNAFLHVHGSEMGETHSLCLHLQSVH